MKIKIFAIIYLTIVKELLNVEMKEIVCKIQPFDLMQTVFLMEDGKQKQAYKIPTKDFVAKCYELYSVCQVDRINIKGHKKYALGLKNQLEKIAKEAYKENNIEIILTK